METFYLEVRCSDKAPQTHYLLSKLFNRIHGIYRVMGRSLGVSFPELTLPSEKFPRVATPGSVLRVFGSSEDLTSLINNSGLIAMIDSGEIHALPICRVPDTATRVAYVRVHPKQFSQAEFLRRQRRRARRGNPPLEQLNSQRKDCRLPYLLVIKDSDLGRLQIPIYIEKVIVDNTESNGGGFNYYGLGNSKDGRITTVFDF